MRPLGKNIITGWIFDVPIATGLISGFGADQAIWQAPLAFGGAYGDVGTVADPSPFMLASDIDVYGNSFNSARDNGQGGLVHGFTGGVNIKIHDNVFPDNSTIAIAIGFDWTFLGPMNSADVGATKAAYLNGDVKSFHMHNISIRNNRIGRMTMPAYPGFGSHGIRAAGGYAIDISDNSIEETTYAGVFWTGGDEALEFAGNAAERYLAYRQSQIRNNRMMQSNASYSIYVECYPDNIYRAATDPGDASYPYTPLYLIRYPTNLLIEGNHCNGNGTSTALEGIFCSMMIGGTVKGNVVQNHQNGIRISDGADGVKVIENHVTNNREAGIFVNGNAVPPNKVLVDSNIVSQNCLSGTGAAGNICVNNAIRTVVTRNDIGEGDESTVDYGVNNTALAVFTTIKDNRVVRVKSGGNPYKFAGAITTVWEFSGNDYEGAEIYAAGLDIIAIRRTGSGAKVTTEYSAKKSAVPGGVPAFGQYVVSDRIRIEDAGAGEVACYKCITAGGPGTHKAVETVAA
jgi:hypothetical protein